ncbi:hemerythrin domain-containing protein [Chitinimonas taiwanensis]|jgi:iron-sulfur cluster repair protein YtfE (RIC family)|uniref:hemerythrin domain-containing protein n=1 Tax=Chitinimonas taiwanensis TaxID=240412 RepID=UPI00161D05B7
MSDPIATLIHQHHEADALLARVEGALRGGDWPQAQRCFDEAEQSLLGHFELEEQQLFPAFEAATGMRHGPTAVMRDEHATMRDLLDSCRMQLIAADRDGLLAELDTLLVLIQQHNVKEENVLYPMCALRVADLATLLARSGQPA